MSWLAGFTVYPALFVGLLGYTNDLVLCGGVALFNIGLYGYFLTTISRSSENRVLITTAICFAVSLAVNVVNCIFIGLLSI